ncbi:MAG: hypothetical protein MJ170_03845 [Alphaproteobacteria bacterium]|nr:hypothetical protein [Alphaproteobacteria bacterium]
MKGRSLLSLLVLSAFTTPVVANWQNADPRYTSSYDDNGARFVVSARGGVAWGNAKIQNDIGALTAEYYYNPDTQTLITAAYCELIHCEDPGSGFKYAGYDALGNLPANENYSRVSFAAGASVGFTMPNAPQWRIEAGWDRISVAEYNVSPLFSGNLNLMDGKVGALSVPAESGAVQSKVSTDIVSIMAYYDFFSGNQKQVGSFVPYIGLGLGYADSLTELQLSDIYGDLSDIQDLVIYGDAEGVPISPILFYKSSKRTSNVAGLGALGISYGVTERVFLDFSARVMYIPEIKWKLTNIDNTREKDWFSAKNMIYTNLMLGIRFEF